MHQSQPSLHSLRINLMVHLELWPGNHLIWCNATFKQNYPWPLHGYKYGNNVYISHKIMIIIIYWMIHLTHFIKGLRNVLTRKRKWLINGDWQNTDCTSCASCKRPSWWWPGASHNLFWSVVNSYYDCLLLTLGLSQWVNRKTTLQPWCFSCYVLII